MSTTFDDDWSSSKEMATVEMAILDCLQICISDVIDMIRMEVPMLPLILVTIGQIVKKWQQFSKSKMVVAAILNHG